MELKLLPRAKNVVRRSTRLMRLYRQRDTPLARGTFRCDPSKMRKVIVRNRALLDEFGPWIDPDAMARSTLSYGLSPEWASAMQFRISEKMTYSDVLSYIASEMSRPTEYLEIGVSVGKNFWQGCITSRRAP